MQSSFRRVAAVALSGLILWVAGCVTVPHSITLGEGDIARALDRHLPIERRVLDVFDVRLSAPHVTLLPDSDRLATDFDLAVGDRLGGRRWQTHVALDYGLRYDESDQAVHLADVRVRQLQGDLGAPSAGAVQRVSAIVAEQLLEGTVVYRFKPEDLRTAQGLGVKPGAIHVTPRGVEIALVPSR